MNLLTIEWQNRGLNMWTFEEASLPLVAGTAAYALPDDTIDLLEHVIRTGAGTTQTDIAMTRISLPTYASIPNKTATGRPLQIYVHRGRDNPTVTVWPVPDNSQAYTLRYWRMRRIENAGAGVEEADVQFRFFPALVSGLAYYIAMKRAPERTALLKAVYDEEFQRAADEDIDRVPLKLTPGRPYMRA